MVKGLTELEVVTLFVDDLVAAKTFYTDVFRLSIVGEDEESALLRFGSVMVNLLRSDQAPDLIEPTPLAADDSGARLMFTIRVDDVDGLCAQLKQQGVDLLNGPIDRPWGRRTAAFADPAGNVWEVAQVLSGT